MKKLFYIITYALVFSSVAYAQENADTVGSALTRINSTLDVLSRIKISGYIQGQYQVADMADSLGMLNGITSYAGGNFAKGVDKRFMLRRARVKIQYDAPLNEKGISTSQYVFQIDATERGIVIKDMYAKITDPWSGWFSMTVGNQNRPFGFEIGYSSSLRESPERGRMSQILFPNERDMGAMLTIQGPKWTRWNWLKLEAGLFNGTGAPGAATVVNGTASGTSNTSDFDKYKDFIGHLSVNRTTKSEKISWGLGVSMYSGGYRIDTVNVYKSGDSASVTGFTLDQKKSDNILITDFNNRHKAAREYIGFDAKVNISSSLGITTLRGEYIQGEHAGTSSSTTSPAAAVTSDIYIRKFNGAYFYFIQSIGQSKWQAVVKYDWYDPNTDVEGDVIGKSVGGTYKTTGTSDLKYTTLGFGLVYRWDANVKLTGYFDSIQNETTTAIPAYRNDLKDNVFTLRMQVKF